MFDEGLHGKKWATRCFEGLPDISHSANQPRKPILLKPRKRILLKHGLHAAFGFPLYAEGRLQAVLEFFSTTRQLPDKHLLYIVESIGEQLGRVLERQQGQEQQRQAVAISDALNLTTIRSEALEATLNALTSGVYLTDRHGRIVYMNRAAERQVGTSNAIRVANSHLSPIDHKARLALDRAIDEAIGDEADLPTSGFTIALPAGRQCRSNRHRPPARARRKPKRGLRGNGGNLRARPDRDAALPGPGLRRTLWPHEERATCAPRHGARA